jgi:dihydroxy-acid dehydratase
MITNTWRGERLGACTDCRRMWARGRAGTLSSDELTEVEGSLATTPGTCMVMGTASTMATMAESLGMMLPGGATPPSATGDRLRHASATGRRAVGLAREGTPARDILTREAFENALTVLAAVGGSTNAVVHLLAVARRTQVDLTLADFDRVSALVPLLLDLKPSGQGYMEDFHRAGGVPVLLKALETRLDTSTVGVTGTPLRELLEGVQEPQDWQRTIRTLDDPLGDAGALAVLTGSLAPEGAVLKVSAASPGLLQHTGPAVVFDSAQDAVERLDDDSLGITKDSVLVLRNSGPVGAGMPEAGSLPIPKVLAAQGITDMVRVSDARMSGTSYGTVVLHCAPESAVGGPLGLVRDGDLIRLDVPRRSIDLLVPEDDLAQRRTQFQPPPLPERGWRRLYAERVTSAAEGADLDFLQGTRPGAGPS